FPGRGHGGSRRGPAAVPDAQDARREAPARIGRAMAPVSVGRLLVPVAQRRRRTTRGRCDKAQPPGAQAPALSNYFGAIASSARSSGRWPPAELSAESTTG